MARRCPQGTICFENMTLIVLTLVLVGIGIYVFSNHFTGNGKSRGNALVQINSQPSILIPSQEPPSMLDFGAGGPPFREDVLQNPHAPPLRDNTTGNTHPVALYNVATRPVGMRVNVPTQSVDATFRQVGILTRVNGGSNEMILPLMGRPLFTNRDKWNFYTMSDRQNSVKLPVLVKGRSGMNEYGCDNVYNGDTVFVEGYNEAFKVTAYDSATVRYLPF